MPAAPTNYLSPTVKRNVQRLGLCDVLLQLQLELEDRIVLGLEVFLRGFILCLHRILNLKIL